MHAQVNRIGMVSDYGLSPILHKTITWFNAYLLPIEHTETNVNEDVMKTQ